MPDHEKLFGQDIGSPEPQKIYLNQIKIVTRCASTVYEKKLKFVWFIQKLLLYLRHNLK